MPSKRKNIAFGFLGTQMDYAPRGRKRWDKWRPTISLCWQNGLQIDQLHLIHDRRAGNLANTITKDIFDISPGTQVVPHLVELSDPWDLEEVYAKLFDLLNNETFDTDACRYLAHITTGTHIAQICWFLLTESRHFPGEIIQTSPGRHENKPKGRHQIIDLDLSRYDQVASRFRQQRLEGESFLKKGIVTRNKVFNAMIQQIETVAVRSKAPILLTGPTGAGKTQLASRIYALKKQRELIKGAFVSVNCATLRGEGAMSALFGHVKGAFTGAQSNRQGFLKQSDGGMLFLDEIGELGLDEQAMLLHALESGEFYPVGADATVSSRFQLIAGTNRDLAESVAKGVFREDLLARINLWTYRLPSLAERREDIEANLDYELHQFSENEGHRVEFNREARTQYLNFALSPRALWSGNFRDLNASVIRMATLCDGSRIGNNLVNAEIARLESGWRSVGDQTQELDLADYLPKEVLSGLDLFDALQLRQVLAVCRRHTSFASAGRELFDKSRLAKTSSNDTARLQRYLAKFGLNSERVLIRR